MTDKNFFEVILADIDIKDKESDRALRKSRTIFLCFMAINVAVIIAQLIVGGWMFVVWLWVFVIGMQVSDYYGNKASKAIGEFSGAVDILKIIGDEAERMKHAKEKTDKSEVA